MEDRITQIRKNLLAVRERIDHAAASSGRDPSRVRLVVVTKAQPVDVIEAAIKAGAAILGENYPEETVPKIQAAAGSAQVEWHMIGHLQSRKANLVADHFQMIHSLDSLKLAQKLDRLMVDRGGILPVLLELNVGGEESKYGYPAWEERQWEALLPEIEQILQLPGLSLRGLMTMPPLFDDPENTRPFFAILRCLSEYLTNHFEPQYFQELSMGTSADYEAAVQEGATLVRIGTAIVGPRPARVQL